jgi:sugar transferase (PEP-CTERM system associated)
MLRFFKLPLARIGVVFFILDTVAIFGAVYLAAAIRKLDLAGLDKFIRTGLFLKALLVVVAYLVLMYFHDLMYHVTKLRRRGMELQLLQAVFLLAIVLFTLYYWFPALSLGRGIFFLMMPMILAVSATFRMIYLRLTQNPVFGEKVLILGSQGMARSVGEEIMKRADMGFRIAGFVDENPANVGKPVLNPKVIGSYNDVDHIINKEKIQTVIVAIPDRRGKLPFQDLLQCKLRGVRILDGVSFYERMTGKISVEELKPSWLIFSDGFNRPKTILIAKRFLDLTMAFLGILLLLPLFPMIVLLIKLNSPGPIFYVQERVGEKGNVFNLLKFRSMQPDAEKITGPTWAQENDARITRVGHLLRKLRIDELPQLWNVLKGEMSFVGPRPERPNFVHQLEKEIPFYSLRLSVKPGITGWAQIRYQYGSSIEDAMEKMQYDLYYIKNMSILFDQLIIFQTIKIALLGRGAR